MYPHLHKKIAIACLFLPSLLFWGVGLLKDTICYSLYAAPDLFIWRLHIILPESLYPDQSDGCLYALDLYAGRVLIADGSLRQIATILVVGIAGAAAFLVIQGFASSEITSQFTTDNIVKAAQDQQQTFVKNKIGTGSNFKVAAVENSVGSMAAAFPLGVVNTFYRPFPLGCQLSFYGAFLSGILCLSVPDPDGI